MSKIFWIGVAASLVGDSIVWGLFGAGKLTMEFTLLITAWIALAVSASCAAYGIWFYWPSRRRREAFKAFAPEIEGALTLLAGGLDSFLAKKADATGAVTPAYAQVTKVLKILEIQFGIKIDDDAFGLIRPDQYEMLASVLAYAQTGDVKAAKELKFDA